MNHNLQIPLFFPRRSQVPPEGLTILAGDIGGTKTNMALFVASRDGVDMRQEATYHSASYPSFNAMISQFLKDNRLEKPDRICAGVAGPVVQGKVRITNLPEELDQQAIQAATGVTEVSLLNDLEATAYGLAALEDADLLTINPGRPAIGGNMAVIAPGTGLGEAGMYWNGRDYFPFPTEGGHCDFSPRSSLDIELFHFLRDKYGVVSWERVVSGPAIHDIYLFLRQWRKLPEPAWLSGELGRLDPAAAISAAAIQGTDPVCVETMEVFIRYLAREASNLVLKMKATGGLFLGGGIPPKIIPLLQGDLFMKNFLDCDRMQELLEAVPVWLITKDKTALLGAAYFGAFGPFS